MTSKERVQNQVSAKAKPSLIYQVSRVMASNRYLDEILLLVVQMTAQLTGSKICSLMLLNEKKDLLMIKATQSLSEAYRSKPHVQVAGSLSGEAVREKITMTIRDVKQDLRFQYPEIAKQENLCSLAVVPMIAKDHVIGVLNCYTEGEHFFLEEELEVLTVVANQAAMAIENTQLLAEKIKVFEELKTRKTVDQAKRILINKKGLSEDVAYRLIQKQSMDLRKSVKEVAGAIILANKISVS